SEGEFQALEVRISALEDENENPTSGTVRGVNSIHSQGLLQNGFVFLYLVGDVDHPGNTEYYGTSDTGIKGWYPVAGALAVTSNLTKSVGADGVATFDLSNVTVTTGGALKRYGFDAKGRLSESDDAILSDLSDVSDTPATDGQVLMRESGAWVPKNAAPSGGVPYLIQDGETFTVPERIQDLFAADITIQGSGDLNVEGMLINVGGG